jgi:hypothetical protein
LEEAVDLSYDRLLMNEWIVITVFALYKLHDKLYYLEALRVLNRASSKCPIKHQQNAHFFCTFISHLHVSAHLDYLQSSSVTEYLSLKMSYIQTFIGMEWYCVYVKRVKIFTFVKNLMCPVYLCMCCSMYGQRSCICDIYHLNKTQLDSERKHFMQFQLGLHTQLVLGETIAGYKI